MKFKKLLETNAKLVQLMPKEAPFYVNASRLKGRVFNSNSELPHNFPFDGQLHISQCCSIVCLLETKRNEDIAPKNRDAKPFINTMSKPEYLTREKAKFGSHNCEILHHIDDMSENECEKVLRLLVDNAESYYSPMYYANFKKQFDMIESQLPKIAEPKKSAKVETIEESETESELPKATKGRKKSEKAIEESETETNN